MSKSVQKERARLLRKQGESIKEIARKLSVSPGSVSTWCRDIELTSSQIAILEKRAKDPFYGKRNQYLKGVKLAKDTKIRELMALGIGEIGKVKKRELFLMGVALYWAEGFKKDKQVGFANTDPAMIKFFIKWLSRCFGYTVSDLSIRATINISHKKRTKEIESYWSKITKISPRNFQKPYYQKTQWKKLYENPQDYHGVLRIKVKKSLDFLRKIHGYIEGLRLSAT